MAVFYRFWDITMYCSKISVFCRLPTLILFEALARGSPGTEDLKIGLKNYRLRALEWRMSSTTADDGVRWFALSLQSLMELHKRRRTITEPECRYFVHQVALGCAYVHRAHVIHRDLKLGNLFLNDAMEIKIGDFGLATRLDYDGERKLYASLDASYL